MKPMISRFDDYWSLHLNGYITLLNKDDFHRAIENARGDYSKEDQIEFLVAVTNFSRLVDSRKHRKIEKSMIASIRKYFSNGSKAVPEYSFEGNEAIANARIFLEACIMSPASEGCLSLEDVSISDSKFWMLSNHYYKNGWDRLVRRKTLINRFFIKVSDIKMLRGYSTEFAIRVADLWYEVTCEGVKEVH